jgi:NAD(P)-dependent dehydrogenase (short-subunit alcohol dehydrogenase family)
MRLQGKAALITGASQGIGAGEVAELALLLASEGSAYVSGTCISIDGGNAAELYVPGM